MTVSPVDFESVFQKVEGYSPPIESMHTPSEVEPEDNLTATLDKMLSTLAMKNARPEACAFYVSPRMGIEIFKERTNGPSQRFEVKRDQYLGQPIRECHTLGENAILLMAPDSVTLGGQVINPLTIAYTRYDD